MSLTYFHLLLRSSVFCQLSCLLALAGVCDRTSPAKANECSQALARYGDTGSKCHPTDIDLDLTVRIDWLNFTFPLLDTPDQSAKERVFHLLDLARAQFNDVLEISEGQGRYIGRQYCHAARGARGALYTWNLPTDDVEGGGTLRMSFNGATLAHCRQDDLWLFVNGLLHEFQGKCTRCDVAIDDYRKQMSPQWMLDAYERGDYGRFRDINPVASYKNGELASWTIYFGSRESESFVRYYDKDAETNGAVKAYRLEAEFKGDKAQKVVEELSYIPMDSLHELAPQYLSGVVLGCLAFVDRDGRRLRLSRAQPLPWWQEFCDRVGTSIRVVVPRPRPTLEKKARWIQRSVVNSVAALKEYNERHGLGHFFVSWWDGLIREAQDNLNHQNQQLVEAAHGERFMDVRDLDEWIGRYQAIT